MPATATQPDATGEEFFSQQELNDLLQKVKGSLVNQYPTLAKNSQFQSDLDDAMSRFVNEARQRGSDPQEVWNNTVGQVQSKWEAQAPRDIQSDFMQRQSAFDRMRAAGVPALDAAEVTGVLNTKNPLMRSDQSVVNRDINFGSRPGRMDALQKADLAAAVKKYTTDKYNVDHAGKNAAASLLQNLEKDRQEVRELEGAAPGTSSRNAPASSSLSSSSPFEAEMPAIMPSVATPQGTSGYVQYDADGNPIMPADAQMNIGGKVTKFGNPPASAALGSPALPVSPPKNNPAPIPLDLSSIQRTNPIVNAQPPPPKPQPIDPTHIGDETFDQVKSKSDRYGVQYLTDYERGVLMAGAGTGAGAALTPASTPSSTTAQSGIRVRNRKTGEMGTQMPDGTIVPDSAPTQ